MWVLILVTALFALEPAVRGICPRSCTCQDFPASDSFTIVTAATCTSFVNLTELPNTTNKLTVRDSTIRDDFELFIDNLVNASNTYLHNFTSLSLRGCSLQNIQESCFEGLERLLTLDLSENDISDLQSPDALSNLTQLLELDLSSNKLQTISGGQFSVLKSLNKLNLSSNCISNVSSDGFSGLDNLVYLDLSRNDLYAVDGGAFAGLPMLQHLNLSGNRLETLAGESFGRLARLQQLDVSRNQLTSIEAGALQALPSLARLTLAGNPHLGDLLVGTGRRLQAVDASCTGLEHVPPALTRSVRALRLAGNSIRALSCGDLDSYPLLRLLDLTDNGLQNIEDDALGRLEMLSMLYLSENQLRTVPRSLPTCLNTLHLERNRIERISVGDFAELNQLEILLLNDNEITILEENSLDDLSSLVTLDLSGNPLSSLGALSGPIGLQVLRLAGLPMAAPARDTAFPVHTPERLVNLDLTASPGLARVLLADTAALAASRNLQELSLAEAGLVHIRQDLLYFLTQLRALHLTGNRLDCSGLLWLAHWLRQQNREEDRSVICAAPPYLAGSLLIDLQEGDVPESTTLASTQITTLSTSRYVTSVLTFNTFISLLSDSAKRSNVTANVSVNNENTTMPTDIFPKATTNKIHPLNTEAIKPSFEYSSSVHIDLPMELVNWKHKENEQFIQNVDVINDDKSFAPTSTIPTIPQSSYNADSIMAETVSNKSSDSGSTKFINNKEVVNAQSTAAAVPQSRQSNYTISDVKLGGSKRITQNNDGGAAVQPFPPGNDDTQLREEMVEASTDISIPLPPVNLPEYVNRSSGGGLIQGGQQTTSLRDKAGVKISKDLFDSKSPRETSFNNDGDGAAAASGTHNDSVALVSQDKASASSTSVSDKIELSSVTSEQTTVRTKSASSRYLTSPYEEDALLRNKEVSQMKEQMSMFRSGEGGEIRDSQSAHPGLLVAGGVLATAAAIILIMARWSRRRSPPRDIEVNHLPAVTDLW